MDAIVQLWVGARDFVIANKDDIRNWGLLVIPTIAVYATWKTTIHTIQRDDAEEHRLLEDREEQEKKIVHTENAEQTNAMTAQFRAIMEGYQSRVTDLSREVIVLRTEIVSLRKALDRQRIICGNCPQLRHLLPSDDDAYDATTNT